MSVSLLRRSFRKAAHHVSPFLVLGDPTPDLSVELARAAADAGASMLEIGFPYSDPVADGPAIQAAALRALAGGTSTRTAFAILARIRAACPALPLNLLVYGNLVHALGYSEFCNQAAQAGASSLLVPDIPYDEALPLRAASRRARLGHVQIVGPLTPPARLAKIEAVNNAFLYLVAQQGVTGAQHRDSEAVGALVTRISTNTRHSLCIGFGLSQREQLLQAFRAGATIAVVGSHLARVIKDAWRPDDSNRDVTLVAQFGQAVQALTADPIRAELRAC